MTEKQARVVKMLRRRVIQMDGHGDKYEYKRFEITESHGLVSVVSTVGLIGDEGTAASILCRTHRHILVGKRGGLTLVNAARFVKKDGRLRKIPRANVKGARALWTLTK